MDDQSELQDTRTQRSVSPLSHTSFRRSGPSQYYGRAHVYRPVDTEFDNAQLCQSTLVESTSNNELEPTEIEPSNAQLCQSTLVESAGNNELEPTEKGAVHTPATARWSRLEIDSWIKELSALLISLLSLLCIFVTLRIHDGRPLPSWPLSITINAVVSLFSTVMGMTLLVPLTEGISQAKWLWFRQYHPLSDMGVYDRGSRGPWGALEMLWIVRWR